MARTRGNQRGRQATRRAADPDSRNSGPTSIDDLLSVDGADFGDGGMSRDNSRRTSADLLEDPGDDILADDRATGNGGDYDGEFQSPEELEQDLHEQRRQRRAPQRQQQRRRDVEPEDEREFAGDEDGGDEDDALPGFDDAPGRRPARGARVTREAEILNGLMADPDIRKVVEAKAQGKAFRIADAALDGNDQGQEEQEPDFDSMTNKELAAYTKKQAKKLAEEMVAQQVAPLQQRLQQAELRQHSEKTAHQMRQVVEKYPEARSKEHKENILSYVERFKGEMSPIEMFALSYGLRALRERRTNSRTLASERPTSTSARPSQAVQRSTRPVPPNGPQGMRAIIERELKDFRLDDFFSE